MPENFLSLYIPRELLRFFLPPDPPIISEVSDLVTGLFFSSSLVWQDFFGILLVPKGFSVFSGIQNSHRGLIRACERCPGKSSPCLLVLLFSDKEVILGYLP